MQVRDYTGFWQRIHNSAKKNKHPLRVMFELTYRCNFRCRHCYLPLSFRKKPELKTKEIFFILDQLAQAGCFYLGFTGGEPFMRPDIIEILTYAKNKGFSIIVYSNGSLIDKAKARMLGKLKPNKVDITIPALDKNIFEKITRLDGSQKKVFRAIEYLRANKVPLGFKSCVLKDNQQEIPKIRQFCRFLGALHRLDDMLNRRLDGTNTPYRYRGILKDDSLIECSESRLAKNRRGNSLNIFNCGAGLAQAVISPQGEFKLCLFINEPRFKILKLGLKGAWEKLKQAALMISAQNKSPCRSCDLEIFSKWCPARSWGYNRTFNSCIPECQQWVESRRTL